MTEVNTPALDERLRAAVESGDDEGLRDVIEEAIRDDMPRRQWNGRGKRPNLPHWLYLRLSEGLGVLQLPDGTFTKVSLGRGSGVQPPGDQEVRARIVRTLYGYGMSTRQIALALGIGKGTIHEVTKDMQEGVSVGLDGIARKRGVRSGGRPRLDLTGQEFGRLTVMGESDERNGRRYWLCKCGCGKEVEVRQDNLTTGRTEGCGCRQGISDTGPRKRMPNSYYEALRAVESGEGPEAGIRWLKAWELYQTGRGPKP